MAKTKAPWVVVGGKIGELGHCERCGTGLSLGGPQHLLVAAAAMDAFVDIHKDCTEGLFKEPQAFTPQDWLHGRDTGMSSRTIYAVMMNTPAEPYDVPHDPSDFGRCYRLLKLFPEWKVRITEMVLRFPEWIPFVREWDTLTEMYETAMLDPDKPASAMYNLMQALLKEAGKR